ncbi:FAD-dependent monooxygenase [Amycolatopsis sp. NBC_00345]|uniref:FAD-dependent monooxygenase n=1 Tax=Amycolatopsis sp. NBC_00345 TaxID=2975955 RepID=UPI002E25A330
MAQNRNSARVLVVGAGPVGLLLGAELLAQGVDVQVIDKAARLGSPHSRATVLWPRILELLDRVEVTDRVIGAGHYFDRMNYYSRKKRVGELRLDRLRGTRYPYGIAIAQSRTEQILEERFAELGGVVRTGCELRAVSQTPDRVDVMLREAGTTPVTEFYDWVVGADGSHSAVRQLSGFTFDGQTLPVRLAITDAELVGEVTKNEAAYFLTERGNMALGPMGGDVFRVAASVPAWYTGGDEPGRELFERLLAERVPGIKEVGEMRFSAIFTAHVRTADTFRRGRVFLVGDAAHVMSPAGAQGMNTGIQDAANLAWKLAGVSRGRYGTGILESYDAERRPAVARVASATTFLARIGLYTDRTRMTVRDLTMRIGSATGVFDRSIAPRLAQLDTSYGPAGPGDPMAAGQRVPLGWTGADATPTLAPDTHTVLLWPGAEYRAADWVPRVAAIQAVLPGLRLIDLAGRPPGALLGRLGRSRAAFVVRPDGHLATLVDLAQFDIESGAAAVAAEVARSTARAERSDPALNRLPAVPR